MPELVHALLTAHAVIEGVTPSIIRHTAQACARMLPQIVYWRQGCCWQVRLNPVFVLILLVVELCKACILVSSYLIFCFSTHMTGETAFPGVSSTPVLTAGTVYFIDGTLVERDVKFARLSKGLD